MALCTGTHAPRHDSSWLRLMVRAVPSERAGRCACSSVASRASPGAMALTPRCGPPRRAGPTGSTCGKAALLHGKGFEVSAYAIPACTLCAQPPALRRRQPVACSHPPPSSHGSAKATAPRSTAPLRIVLTGMHHAHRRHAHHRHAQRHNVRRYHAPQLRGHAVDLRWLSSAAPVRLLVGTLENYVCSNQASNRTHCK